MYTATEIKLKEIGLVDIQEIEPDILVDLKYASTDNFMGEVLYEDIFKAFLVESLARRVIAAHKLLRENHPDLGLIIYDAARPISVQKQMYDKVKGTNGENYVANPYKDIPGGFHNYGLAVDLSIVNKQGEPLDMGSAFDSFSEESHTDFPEMKLETGMFNAGKISKEALVNRKLLYTIMQANQLAPIPKEWWHYQFHWTDEDKKNHILL